jgi:hypothetical protein
MLKLEDFSYGRLRAICGNDTCSLSFGRETNRSIGWKLMKNALPCRESDKLSENIPEDSPLKQINAKDQCRSIQKR